MKVIIEIKCDTIGEFITHLSQINTQLRIETRRLKLRDINDDLNSDSGPYLSDKNCYGTHDVTITND